MLSNKTAQELVSIALAGGNLEVDGSRYTSGELTSVALAGQKAGSRLVIRNSNKFTAEEMSSIALAGKGRVTFA